MLTRHIYIEPWVFAERCHAGSKSQALVFHLFNVIPFFDLSEIYACQPCEIQRTLQIDIDRSNAVLRLFSHAVQGQIRAEDVTLFAEPSIRNCMINSAESLVRCVEESKIVGIRGHIAMYELDRGCCGVQLFLESNGWLVKDIAEEDMC